MGATLPAAASHKRSNKGPESEREREGEREGELMIHKMYDDIGRVRRTFYYTRLRERIFGAYVQGGYASWLARPTT